MAIAADECLGTTLPPAGVWLPSLVRGQQGRRQTDFGYRMTHVTQAQRRDPTELTRDMRSANDGRRVCSGCCQTAFLGLVGFDSWLSYEHSASFWSLA